MLSLTLESTRLRRCHAPSNTVWQSLERVIHVRRGWDDVDGDQDVRTDAGRRMIPLAGALRRALAAHKLRTARTDRDLVFGRTPLLPFTPSTVRRRAPDAWAAAGLEPLSPHEARHCFASYLIASGLNPKQVETYVGHTNIRTTFNVYGHVLEGDVDEARGALDTLLERRPQQGAALSRGVSRDAL